MAKTCSAQEGHPPSRVNFGERLYEKKVDPFARVEIWLSNDNRSPCLDGVERGGLAKACIWSKVDPPRGLTSRANF